MTPIENNHSAWDGYLALADGGNSFSLYNTDTGMAIAVYIWLPVTAHDIFVIDGRVWVGNFYLTGSTNVTVYDIATGQSTELLEPYRYTNARYYINRELHRFIIMCDSSVSMYVVGVYDTQTMGHVNDLVSQHEIYDWCIEWGYVALWRYEEWNYFDLRDLVVKDAAGVNIPTLDPSLADNEFVHTEFVNQTRLSIDLCYTNNGDVFTTVTTKEGEVRLSYYAECGMALANGDVLIYTPGGYGVLIIDVPNGK